jgi:hypothetical protein
LEHRPGKKSFLHDQVAYAYRGETDSAFPWLDRAIRQHDPGSPELKTGPLVQSLRQDPRYGEELKKIGLTR